MSVDTHLKGKNLEPYQRVQAGDVTLLLNPRLVAWSSRVSVDAGRTFLRNKLLVDLVHQHGPGCRH